MCVCLSVLRWVLSYKTQFKICNEIDTHTHVKTQLKTTQDLCMCVYPSVRVCHTDRHTLGCVCVHIQPIYWYVCVCLSWEHKSICTWLTHTFNVFLYLPHTHIYLYVCVCLSWEHTSVCTLLTHTFNVFLYLTHTHVYRYVCVCLSWELVPYLHVYRTLQTRISSVYLYLTYTHI